MNALVARQRTHGPRRATRSVSSGCFADMPSSTCPSTVTSCTITLGAPERRWAITTSRSVKTRHRFGKPSPSVDGLQCRNQDTRVTVEDLSASLLSPPNPSSRCSAQSRLVRSHSAGPWLARSSPQTRPRLSRSSPLPVARCPLRSLYPACPLSHPWSGRNKTRTAHSRSDRSPF